MDFLAVFLRGLFHDRAPLERRLLLDNHIAQIEEMLQRKQALFPQGPASATVFEFLARPTDTGVISTGFMFWTGE